MGINFTWYESPFYIISKLKKNKSVIFFKYMVIYKKKKKFLTSSNLIKIFNRLYMDRILFFKKNNRKYFNNLNTMFNKKC